MAVELDNFEIELSKIKIGKTQGVKNNIVFYGDDNKYPSELESLIDNSESATLCVKTLQKVYGTSFKNIDGNTKVGSTPIGKSYTLNSLLRDIAYYMAKFNGAYILVSKNLEGNIVNVKCLDFTKVRLGEPDSLGRITYVYVGDWTKQITGKRNTNSSSFVKFPIFTNDVNIYKRMAESFKTTASVFPIFSDTKYYYPTNPFESVVNDMATEASVQVGRYNEISNYSPSKLIIRTSLSKDDNLRNKQKEKIKSFISPTGDKVLIISTSFDDNGNPISNGYDVKVIENTLNLDIFTNGEKSCSNNIRKAVQIPGILVDYENATSGVTVSAEQIKISVQYLNAVTDNTRILISESLSELFGDGKDYTINDFTLNLNNNEE